MAQALGVKLLNDAGEQVGLGGGALGEVAHVDVSGVDRRVKEVKVLIASDVTNPLTGPEGASAVFGPQRGRPRRWSSFWMTTCTTTQR